MSYASYCRLNVHIYATDRQVIRAIWKTHFKPYSQWHKPMTETKKYRRDWYKIQLAQHEAARTLAREFAL